MKFPSIKDIRKYFLEHRLVIKTENWARKHSFPGFFKVPIYDVLVFIYNEVRRFDLSTRANSIAFSFFLSLFPAILALFTLIPYLLPLILNDKLLSFLPDGNIDFNSSFIQQMREVMPDSIEDRLIAFIQDVSTTPRVGLLSFGFLLAIFFASNGILTLMKSFEKSNKETFVQRSVVQKRLIAIQLTFLIGTLVFASILLVILGNLLIGWLLDYIHADRFTSAILYILRWIIIVSLFYFGIAILYRLGAPTKRKFNYFSPGTTLATVLSILSSVLFSFYADNFSTYNKLYGSIGTIIVIMLWIQINAFVILIGFELNASIAVNRDLKKKVKE